MQKNELNDIALLEEIQKKSFESQVLIFKHSIRCGISKMALKAFENDLTSNQSDYIYYYLDLINHRDISNAIAQKWNVSHESPQLIILKDGQVKNHASHYSINVSQLD